MSLFLIWWHEFLLDMELDELHERSIAGTCSDTWAAHVLSLAVWRERELARLKDASWVYRFYRSL